MSNYFKTLVENNTFYSKEDITCINNVLQKLSSIETHAEKPGMLLGKIQSGKTKTFIGCIAKAFDEEYGLSIVLTKGTKVLCSQTVARIKKDFSSFIDSDEVDVYDILSMAQLTPYELKKKIIIVAKKQKDNLNRILGFLKNQENRKYISNRKILVIDDEADFASVGFSKQSKDAEIQANVTTKQLNDIRSLNIPVSFLQVTATPYSLYLQPEELTIDQKQFKPIRPAFTELVPVNPAYIGSDYYFSEDTSHNNHASYLYIPSSAKEILALRKKDRRKIKPEDAINSNAIPGPNSAILNLIMGSSILRLIDKKHKKCSFLFHTESIKASHAWQKEVIDAILKQLEKEIDSQEVKTRFFDTYSSMKISLSGLSFNIPQFEECYNLCKSSLIEREILVETINSENDVQSFLDESGQLKLRTPINIFIGGQCLDRGITLANLIGFYYGRRPSNFQQDTVMQHSRMYGYRSKAQLAVTRFYTEQSIYDAMKEMHSIDCALREQLQNTNEQSVVFIQKSSKGNIIPCSPNKILLSDTKIIKSFKRILPVGFQTNSTKITRASTKDIDVKLKNILTDEVTLIKVYDAESILDLISKSLVFEKEEGFDFDWELMKSILSYLSSLCEKPGYIYCATFSGRRISRKASTASHVKKYIDAPDSPKIEGRLRKQYPDYPMLILLRQDGREEEGWKGVPFYWPILSAQKNILPTIFSTKINKLEEN